MNSFPLTRRGVVVVVVGAASAAALISMRQAVAQTAARGGDWLAMVKTHHQLIAKTFESLLDAKQRTFAKRDRIVQTLGYQLTAHSVAEENVLYPALAMNGLVSESDRLYLDQAHAKVKNAELEMAATRGDAAWYDKVQALQAAVLKHATEDEEGMLYPKLQQMLDAPKNAALTAAYRREFASVHPPQVAAPQV